MSGCTSPKDVELQGHPPIELLSSQSLKSKEALGENNNDRRPRIHIDNISLFLSTFLIVLVTSGLGALIVFWFVRHKTQHSLAAAWKDGAFLLDEVTRLEGGLQAARLTGLTLASATVSTSNRYFFSICKGKVKLTR